MQLVFAERLYLMHFHGNHFSFFAIYTCFLKNKNGRARKSYKNLSVTFPTNSVALTLENIKENKKTQKHVLIGDLETIILDWPALGSSQLRVLTGSLI